MHINDSPKAIGGLLEGEVGGGLGCVRMGEGEWVLGKFSYKNKL